MPAVYSKIDTVPNSRFFSRPINTISKMPFLVALDVLAWVGLTAGAIGGPIIVWCSEHPGPGCAAKRSTIGIGKRDVIDMSDVPKLNVERQAVGPCNIPKYNFDLCHDQVKSQTVRVVSSIPAAGGKCSHQRNL